jgi:hypothetical protein
METNTQTAVSANTRARFERAHKLNLLSSYALFKAQYQVSLPPFRTVFLVSALKQSKQSTSTASAVATKPGTLWSSTALATSKSRLSSKY